MNGSTKFFQDVIAKLHKIVTNYHEGLARIDREFQAPKKALTADQERNWETRKSNWKLGFSKEWKRSEIEIASVSSQIRKHQPAFVDFSVEAPFMASEIPEVMLFVFLVLLIFSPFSQLHQVLSFHWSLF